MKVVIVKEQTNEQQHNHSQKEKEAIINDKQQRQQTDHGCHHWIPLSLVRSFCCLKVVKIHFISFWMDGIDGWIAQVDQSYQRQPQSHDLKYGQRATVEVGSSFATMGITSSMKFTILFEWDSDRNSIIPSCTAKDCTILNSSIESSCFSFGCFKGARAMP
jgi:hypothetical protein